MCCIQVGPLGGRSHGWGRVGSVSKAYHKVHALLEAVVNESLEESISEHMSLLREACAALFSN